MSQQTLSGARIIDPIITNVARGLRQPGPMVADALFPIVPVSQRAGRVVSFTAEDFMIANTARAPGANTMRVNYGYASDPYALVDHSLEGVVPVEILEEGLAVPGINHATVALARVRAQMDLTREKEAADKARDANNYGAGNKVALSGTARWSDLANSDPFANMEAWREAIRAQIGMYPNVAVIPPAVLSKLKIHPKVLDRLKYTSPAVPTDAMLADLFEIERVVLAQRVYRTSVTGANIDVWGKDVILAYVDVTPLASMGSPSYGYTYQLSGYPLAEPAYMDRNTKSYVYPYTDARAPVIAGSIAGFLAQTVVA